MSAFRYLQPAAAAGLTIALATGCAAPASRTAIVSGARAYDLVGSTRGVDEPVYRIGALDRLSISVFNEPALTFENIPVDAQGQFEYPLIGTVIAAGKTSSELTAEIKRRLDAGFYRDAQVTVFVNTSSSQFVTVEGSVVQPGRFDLPSGQATLLEVIALAKSPTRTAKLDQVMVFRNVDGQRYGAAFDLDAIRAGRTPDPRILSGDVVVVGTSFVKGAFRDFLQSIPLLNVFRAF